MARASILPRKAAQLVCAAASALAISWPGAARAEASRIESVAIVGASRTRESTLLELLPRLPPAEYTEEELAEAERRIENLAIFDRVVFERRGTALRIEVREKWTLIPSVDFATGKTLADSFAMIGLTEYNSLGTANQTGVNVYREQRGWGVAGWFSEHAYRRSRWSLGFDGALETAGYRFENGSGWRSTQGGGALVLTSPPSFSEWVNQRLGVAYTRETIDEVRGPIRPPNSHAIQTFVGLSWDRYRWQDLVPRGIKAELSLGAGLLAGPVVAQPRHSAELWLLGAHPLGKTTVLMMRVTGSVRTRGNPLFSSLVGSLYGVRGLEDALYRSWIQAIANVELRHAVPVARRWALQGVVFADGAVFERITPEGGRGQAMSAVSTGVGARLVPTWLANVIVRVDGSRLLYPDPRWFGQLALSQYF